MVNRALPNDNGGRTLRTYSLFSAYPTEINQPSIFSQLTPRSESPAEYNAMRW